MFFLLEKKILLDHRQTYCGGGVEGEVLMFYLKWISTKEQNFDQIFFFFLLRLGCASENIVFRNTQSVLSL